MSKDTTKRAGAFHAESYSLSIQSCITFLGARRFPHLVKTRQQQQMHPSNQTRRSMCVRIVPNLSRRKPSSPIMSSPFIQTKKSSARIAPATRHLTSPMPPCFTTCGSTWKRPISTENKRTAVVYAFRVIKYSPSTQSHTMWADVPICRLSVRTSLCAK